MTKSNIGSAREEAVAKASELSESDTLRRTYTPPAIISAEGLEVAAATCQASNATYGKDYGLGTGETCANPGS